jgi:hypothetical protein
MNLKARLEQHAARNLEELAARQPRTPWRGGSLRGADLTEANLYRANLTGADLTEANLRRADLSRANFPGADLRGADLTEADLYRANLREANLRGADLRRANLRRADLTGADLPLDRPDPRALRRAVADHIEANPELHNQDVWGDGDDNPTCGTPCCAAGWACHLGGGARGLSVPTAATLLLHVDGLPLPSFEFGAKTEDIIAALRA